MQLKIENCGKIKKANIDINGITIIAGDNNTGKSTIGKVVYSIFNSFYDLDKKIISEKVDSIRKTINGFIVNNTGKILFNTNNKLYFNIEYDEKDYLNDKVKDYLVRIIEEYKNEFSEADKEKLSASVYERLNVDDEDIIRSMFNRFIEGEFEGQLNNLNIPNSKSNIKLILKGKSIEVKISNKNVAEKLNLNCRISTEAVYIDSPFVLDELSENYLYINSQNEKHSVYLKKMLRRNKRNNLIDEVIIENKLQSIMNKIDTVAPNLSVTSNEGKYTYKDETLKSPLKISNISTGLKTFVIIKMLIENFSIQENGVLILDEPEIHLHPEWQLIFAEIIVLLQKELNLHIILTTHSPYFLNAIEVFSEKYSIIDKCKYYLSHNSGNVSEIKDVTDNVQEIYEKLAMPFQKLENLRANIGDSNG